MAQVTKPVVACVIASLVASCTQNVVPNIGPVPHGTKPFNAKYDFKMQVNNKEFGEIYSTDGRGHAFTNVGPQQQVVDYDKGVAYFLYPKTKTALWVPLKDGNNFFYEENWFRSSRDKIVPLGEKLIDAHLCRGWKWMASNQVELWFDPQRQCLVEGACRDMNHGLVWSAKLTSYADVPLSQSQMRVPQDYNVKPF